MKTGALQHTAAQGFNVTIVSLHPPHHRQARAPRGVLAHVGPRCQKGPLQDGGDDVRCRARVDLQDDQVAQTIGFRSRAFEGGE